MIDSEIHSHFLNKAVLLVDNKGTMTTILRDVFSSYGVAIYEADSGHKAVDILTDNDVDYIITDYLMPKMNGLQLIDWIRKYYSKKLPVIILTDSTTNALEYHVDENTIVIYKPFIFSEIINSLMILNNFNKNAQYRKACKI